MKDIRLWVSIWLIRMEVAQKVLGGWLVWLFMYLFSEFVYFSSAVSFFCLCSGLSLWLVGWFISVLF